MCIIHPPCLVRGVGSDYSGGMKSILTFTKQNWFQLFVILLLVLCYIRLGAIEENAFYTADVVDSSSMQLRSMTEDYLSEIQRNTENTWQILESQY